MRPLPRLVPLATACSVASLVLVFSGCSSTSSTQPLTVTPPTTVPTSASQSAPLPEVTLVAITPSSVMGGTNAKGTVTVDRTALSGDLVISLKSDTPQAASVVDSVTIPKGSTTTDFVVSTKPVPKDASVYVYASRADSAGTGIQRRALIVVKQPQLKSISIPPTLTSGQEFTGTVALNGPAPSQGFVVTLRQPGPGGYLNYPQTVTVEPGNDSADFHGTVGQIPSQRSGQIVAEGGGAVIPANTTLMP